ncbi:hypothetical protein [Nonomuraea turcica]|uniref:hypothetical protein n=1 Tax=Nonomuraea sp. G32 TaxID=3067274 RepID=UPI00273C799A|nr:hypothetical protein [Nonomuraea sp. G32]MDP4505603.1 hypothetical protein [Nonomuraea sp. G32]
MKLPWVLPAAALALALIAVPLAWAAGFPVARLLADTVESGGGWSDAAKRTVSMRFAIRNDGWTSVQVTQVGHSSSFMRLIEADGPRFPLELEAGERVQVELVYQVTDCDNITSEDWPIPVRVERWWGAQTVEVDPSPQEPDVSEEFADTVDSEMPGLSKWHAARASYVCDWQL